ncbi:MAG: hypothetical protein WEB30_17020 [Cyclobacteriaceae bacterium]
MKHPTKKLFRTGSLLIAGALLLCSCVLMKRSRKNYVYDYRQEGDRYQKTWVYAEGDSVRILLYRDTAVMIAPAPGQDQFFLKRSLDFDAMTVGFKYRPATVGLPRQLNTDFNGNAYVGYRLDRSRRRVERTPFGPRITYGHRAFSAGIFGGIGSTGVTPWTTNNLIVDEYFGLVFTRGVGFLLALSHFNVGFGIGWDHLTDRDKDIWIYQNKPWYGLTIGLNLTDHPSLTGNR